MRARSFVSAAVVAAVSLLAAETAAAQQSVNFTVGYFAVRGEDARVDGDVLLENRSLFLFDYGDFGTGSVGADWLVPIGEYFEAAAGIGLTARSVPTIYDRFTRPTGEEIDQTLRLRVVPMTLMARILPLGRGGALQPYVGAGVGVFSWRYSEVGDFIDFTTPRLEIFRDRFVATGTSLGPVAVFGLRAPLGRYTVGGEVRYQKAEGDLNDDFLGPKIDLGGLHYVATFGVRF